MLWDAVQGHEEVKARLRAVTAADEVAHAYLFSGPRGIGKRLVAQVFAAGLLCPTACGDCPTCRQVMAGSHQELVVIEPVGDRIGIEQIRQDVIPRAASRAGRDAYRIILIDDADAMGIEAANAFLRTLEEPHANVVFILVASDPSRLPATILSRCQRLRFRPLAEDDVAGLLRAKHALGEQEADFLCRWAGGSIARAEELLGGWIMECRAGLADAVLGGQAGVPAMQALAERLVDDVKQSVGSLKQRHEQEAKELAELGLATTAAAKQQAARAKRELAGLEQRRYRQMLAVLESLYRDMLAVKTGADPRLLLNADMEHEIRVKSSGLTEAEISGALAAIARAGRLLRSRVSPLLALETLLFNLQEAK